MKIEPGSEVDPISSALQRLHHSVIDEAVPDSFNDLVALIGKKIESGTK